MHFCISGILIISEDFYLRATWGNALSHNANTWGCTVCDRTRPELSCLRCLLTRSGIHGLESNSTFFIYKLLSRKLLKSEVCGNASGYGDSYFTILMLSVPLICTNTEGPSRDRAPSFYILIITVFYTDVYGEEHHTYSNVCHIST